MLSISSTDDFVAPYEERAREETGVLLEAGLKRDRFVDLIFCLTLLLHQQKIIS
jgi:hypothetical protein